MARIAVDMDEVIADALSEHIRLYNRAFGRTLQREHLEGRVIYDVVDPEHCPALRDFLDGEFFANLEVMEGAQEVLRRLSKTHDVFITTAAMEVPKSLAAKYDWLIQHFPFLSPMNFVFCGDKSIVAADYLIDDTARHFLKFKGTGILFDAPHNRNVQGYTRVLNWFEVEDYFARNANTTCAESKITHAYSTGPK